MSQPTQIEPAITHDPAYQAVAPDDFAAMVAVDRYGRRSDAFDAIIGPHNPPTSITHSRSTSKPAASCRWSAFRN